jgi:cysteinyl-tRNA synthetase
VLRLHDTALGQVRELELRDPGRVSMYVCGPTVDFVPHLGHGRFALVYDVLRRYLEWRGFDVRYVSNITDIDDKIIARAHEERRSTQAVVEEYEAAWYEAMDRLGVRRPTEDPHATGYIEQMIALIKELEGKGLAYRTSDGVYLDTAHVKGYGLLAHQSIDSLRAGARVAVDEEKRSPTDFALWKLAKPGEPSWSSPWGDGRPGWHTECVVMSLDLLGDDFDIHGGGSDLIFPHHENERAQAVAAGRTFSRYWVHNGWVVDDFGEKMSKSLGNTVPLSELADGRAYRLLVLRAHYRSPIKVGPATLADAEGGVARLDSFGRRFHPTVPADPEALAQFREFMDDDLNTPRAVALLFDLVHEANTTGSEPVAAAALKIAGTLGLELDRGGDEVPSEVQRLLEARTQRRTEKKFAEADEIKAQITALGWVVEDGPSGSTVRKS